MKTSIKRSNEITSVDYDALKKEIFRCALLLARALHICPHIICYRGCNLHLLGFSARVESNVISFLIAQFICFLLVSLRPSALVVTFSCALGLRNPSAFFSCCTYHASCCFLSYRCLHVWGWILLLTSQMLYVAVQCHYVALGLLLGLLLVPCYINQKSLLICTACTLSNRSYYNFRSMNISACLP